MEGEREVPRNRITPEGRDPRLAAIGDRIRQRRLALKLDQKDLAGKVGVSEKSVSNWRSASTRRQTTWRS